MSSSEKKKKKPLPKPETTPYPSFPDDLLVTCFSRICRLHYPTLSLVSKSFQSLLTSPELYKTRGNTNETCLYVCLNFHQDPNPRWFTLCLKPNKTLNDESGGNKKNSSGYVLAPVSVPNSPHVRLGGLVALGHDIYNIGGSSVSVLDCRSHTWREATNMRVTREDPAINVVDGKIYVAGGGCKNSSEWMEVFDPKKQAWEAVSCNHYGARWDGCIHKSAVILGKIYMFGDKKSLAYKPKEKHWEDIEFGEANLDEGWRGLAYCVVGNVLYCYTKVDGMEWHDPKIRVWKVLKGLQGLPCRFAGYGFVRLVDYGGKLMVFWDRYYRSSGYQNKRIWCAMIALERDNREIFGEVEWLDAVLTVPKSYEFLSAVAATV